MSIPISPITYTDNITLLNKISVSTIVNSYQKDLGMDVSPYFASYKCISLYRCNETGYRFYFPFNISGGSIFYEQLDTRPWYYMDWKWEHDKAMSYIKSKDIVLEIGCGEGSFLQRVADKGSRSIGLELNKHAIEKAKNKGLTVSNEPLRMYSKKHADNYDVVCFFQVLEHISDVKSFLTDSIKLLKKGGRMIISVPNNDSFIFKDNEIILNFPPHHMGLWDSHSLISLQNILDFKLVDIFYEPLQKYHQGYMGIHLKNLFRQNDRGLVKITWPILNKFVSLITPRLAERMSNYVLGHSIMAIFTKV